VGLNNFIEDFGSPHLEKQNSQGRQELNDAQMAPNDHFNA